MSLPSVNQSRSLFEGSSEDNISQSQSFDNMFLGSTSPNKSPGKTYHSPNSPSAFAKDLNQVQEEQVYFMKKMEKERHRKDYLDRNIEEAKRNLRDIQDRTKNGQIVRDHEVSNKKLLGRLEHQLQTSKIKLSTSRNENITLKHRVEDLRREKMLHLQILNDLQKEASNCKRRTKFCQKEVGLINEKKHKVKLAISNLKQKMVRDMEDFSSELNKAKESISNTQQSIMTTIRDKLQATMSYEPGDTMETRQEMVFTSQSHRGTSRGTVSRGANFDHTSKTSHGHGHHNATHQHQHNAVGHTQLDAEMVLKDSEFKSVEDLLQVLQQSEETVFALYNETQSRHEEVEKMELENKHLENQVQEQMTKLHGLEGQQEQVKQELEKNILALKGLIGKYDTDYYRNMEILNGIKENLLNLLKNVAIDEEALDQQLLSTGINDRNIDEFLGLIEQRIDDLIQMTKAANHQALKRDDFLKMAGNEKNNGFQMPVPPSLTDANDDDDDMEETAKLQPLNITVLKEIIQKKVQKMTIGASNNSKDIKKLDKFPAPAIVSQSGLRSRQTSSASIRSTESKNVHEH